jgi:hypothetical protein
MFLQVRAQHMERAVDFLVKELKVCTQKEAHERIFFVSAREALQARLQEQKGLPAHSENKTITQPYSVSECRIFPNLVISLRDLCATFPPFKILFSV